ncbi:hypothetical protein JCM19294_847 [Nonlabens tegetincola]|uniref:Apea-like HEPN domain-containing protein n=1 Tax=Nonlabens tegetincola TaxID=323273 RepID=A0A090Q543_9FLAO|nr:hypothetical protein [Nonlabens tegetincola]GAK98214.1 hypothetical protein JCM19294_847 [Nonlabens tegetincola]
MIEWINNKFGTNFTENDLKNIKDFSLLWNIFENLVCDRNCTINRIEESLNPIEFQIEDFENHLNYFKERYTSDNNTNERFEYLRIVPNARKEFVKQVLLGNDNNTSNKILALAIIVYRYRNNLFHGEKNFMLLNEQEENFSIANQVLTSILTHF